MNYQKDFRPFLNNFNVKHKWNDFSIIVHFHIPDECSCGHPHATLIFQPKYLQMFQLCDFSMETKESYSSMISSIDALFRVSLHEEIQKNVELQKNSLVVS